jgi:hypothetical protein
MPKIAIRTESATEIVAVDQPNSCCSGLSSTDGVDIAPAVVSKVRNVMPTTIQP